MFIKFGAETINKILSKCKFCEHGDQVCKFFKSQRMVQSLNGIAFFGLLIIVHVQSNYIT